MTAAATLVSERIVAAKQAGPLDRADRGFVTVGIGGHGGSGKSTLAAVLHELHDDVQIVGTDSFWNGSLFDLARLRHEMLDVVLRGEPAVFNEWDWHAKKQNLPRTVFPTGVIVVEGVCALHQMFRDDLDVRVWVEASHDVRLARGVARDGEAMRKTWTDVWIPNEERYVAADNPMSCAHMIVDGTVPYL
jgi:uridine kinase